MIIDNTCKGYLSVKTAVKIDKNFAHKKATVLSHRAGRFIVIAEDKWSDEEKEQFKALLPEQSMCFIDGSPQPKDMTGKPILSLVPRGIVEDIAKVREFGNRKYGNPDGWKMQTKQDYWEACLRHAEKARNNMDAVDEESGLPHIWHLACDLSFILSGEIK